MNTPEDTDKYTMLAYKLRRNNPGSVSHQIAADHLEEAGTRIMQMEKQLLKYKDIEAELVRYFTSGNRVPVERATILARDFWCITGLDSTKFTNHN